MLVDGAIVVVELADRKMAEGLSRRRAFAVAAQRMAWPISAATATTLAAFMPLLFWPGLVGEFMKYLPITLIATLSASLLMALIFVPTLGALVGKRAPDAERKAAQLCAAETGDLNAIGGAAGVYVRLLRGALAHPGKVTLAAVLLLVGVYAGLRSVRSRGGIFSRRGTGERCRPRSRPRRSVGAGARRAGASGRAAGAGYAGVKIGVRSQRPAVR